jgi:simple sugar transport system ATP-binding protein
MNMLSGIYCPDSGQIEVDGKEVSIRSPKDALSLGIGMIHQHYKLVDVMNATQNIILGLKEDKYDLKAASARVREICERYGLT